MKVLLINGSAHQKGNTFHALSMAAKTLEAQGIETEIMQIGNKPVRGCIACGVCKKKGNNRCTFDDDVCNRFLEKAADADGFIFGSPVYYGQPNGALLAVVQRMLMAGGSLDDEQASGERRRVPPGWRHCHIPDDEHGVRDDEHAHRHLAVLEHCLRTEAR